MNFEQVKKFNDTLSEKSYTIFCAESVTAGLIASTIASAPGASCVLKGSIVSYTEEVKIQLLKVDPQTIETHTAESKETTIEMVKGLAELNPGADIYIAITGVASEPVNNDHEVDKPVGQMYIAILFSGLLYSFDPIIEAEEGDATREAAVEYVLEKVLEVIS